MQNDTIFWDCIDSAVGDFYAALTDRGICRVMFDCSEETFLQALLHSNHQRDQEALHFCMRQVQDYFTFIRKSFNLRLDLSAGTRFQQRVWLEVCKVPYGETRTYAQIAAAIGSPNAYRAVGAANGQNPLPIIVPCHRLIGSDGSLHGYGAGQGIPTKRWLLSWEGPVGHNI